MISGFSEVQDVIGRVKRSKGENDGSDSLMRNIITISSFVFLVLLTCIIWLLFKLKKEKVRFTKLREETSFEDAQEVGRRAINDRISYDTSFEIEMLNLEISKETLGKGHYGYVSKGFLLSVNLKDAKMPVAVKRSNKEGEIKLFKKEIIIMCEIEKQRHPNVLSFVGAITTITPDRPDMYIVTELAYNDLENYFKENNHNFVDRIILFQDSTDKKTGEYDMTNFVVNDDVTMVCTFDLLSFAYQIANGMKHLSTIPCVHRDLALRNVLITNNKVCRIGDFGLARKHTEAKQYYKRKYDQDLPIERMAPESFANGKYFDRFTEKSDIWTFAICLHELFTLGRNPEKLVPGSLIEYLRCGKRLDEPEYCLSDIFEFMESCWKINPNHRPGFLTCVVFFELQLIKFSKEAYQHIQTKLASERENQNKLKDWVTKQDDKIRIQINETAF